jgi:hypothetical protein
MCILPPAQRRAALATSISGSAATSSTEEFYKGSVDCFKQVISKYGIKGLYRGFTSTIVRDMQVRETAVGPGVGLLRTPARQPQFLAAAPPADGLHARCPCRATPGSSWATRPPSTTSCRTPGQACTPRPT